MNGSISAVLMTADEARKCVDFIRGSMESARRELLRLYEGRGWEALGYSNWRECVIAEFSQSQTHLYRQLQAAQIERDISPIGETMEISESQLRPLAAVYPENRAGVWQQAIDTAPNGKMTAAHVEKVVNGFTAKPFVSHNTGKMEWYTPAEYIEAAVSVMGGIDLDPASSAISNKTVGAKRFYSKEDDGLTKSWRGRVWLNPPYATELIGPFIAKLVSAFEHGEVTEAIVLVNNATETIWFNDLIGIARAVVFPRGRIKYLNSDGNPEGKPLQGQAIVYAGKSPQAFLDSFSVFGWGARLC